MISQTHHIVLSILLISLSLINNNEAAASDVIKSSNTLNTRLRSNTNLRLNSNSQSNQNKVEYTTKIVSDIVDGKSRRELQEDVVDKREDSIEGQEELFISQNCLNLLAGKCCFSSYCVYCVCVLYAYCSKWSVY